jgi:hypothetical protein
MIPPPSVRQYRAHVFSVLLIGAVSNACGLSAGLPAPIRSQAYRTTPLNIKCSSGCNQVVNSITSCVHLPRYHGAVYRADGQQRVIRRIADVLPRGTPLIVFV